MVPIQNAEAVEELDRLREALLSGEATKFYAFSDAFSGDSFSEAVFCGGEWEITEIIGALGSLQSMELAYALDDLLEKHEERRIFLRDQEDDPELTD